MKIIPASSGDEFTTEWQRMWSSDAVAYPAYSPSNIQYYKAYWKDRKFEDHSFLISSKAGPIMGALITFDRDKDGLCQLSAYGLPVHFAENVNVSLEDKKHAYRLLKQKFDEIIKNTSPEKITYWDFISGGSLSYLGRKFLDLGACAKQLFVQTIDLSQEISIIRSDLSKTYKWNVNWGEKNLDIEVIDHKNLSLEKIEDFRDLHISVAGRETRSKESWSAQFDMIKNNEAFAVLGNLEGDLVTAALFSHSHNTCVYGVSASNRDLFDKPLSHVLVWKAICHAKTIGCLRFECGEVLFPGLTLPPPTEKELGISRFKLNFGGVTQPRILLTWKPADNAISGAD